MMTENETQRDDYDASLGHSAEFAQDTDDQPSRTFNTSQAASWERVLAARLTITHELESIINQLSGARRRRAHDVKIRLGKARQTEDVLQDVDLLRICLPLTNGAGELPVGDVQNVLHQVIHDPSPSQSSSQRWRPAIIYPLMLLAISSLVLVAFSVLITPTFERMFGEFGLMLPAPTKLVFAIARVLPIVLMVALALLLVFLVSWAVNTIRRRYSATAIHLIPWFGPSTRSAWAHWAWHLSMLLEAGLAKPEAVRLAGQSSTSSWLRKGSCMWSEQMKHGLRPFHQVTHFRRKPCRLLAHAVDMDEGIGETFTEIPFVASQQAAFLREVAAIYWERERGDTDRWLAWLTPVAVCLVGLIIGFFVIALFMPLVSIVSGLS